MTSRVIKQPKARRDITQLGLYLKQHSPAAARRFLDAVEQACRKLAAMPEMGSLWGAPEPELAGLRCWPIHRFENYLIFYRPLPDGIEVVRVLHGSQDVERLLGGAE